MDTPITRAEHEEFCRRMEDEHHRISKRLDILENTISEIGKLTSSVEKLALNMESMTKSQAKQELRLEELEGRDGEMWRKVVGYMITFAIGAVLSFAFAQIGM